MLNLQHVHAFLAVIDSGSFREASRQLSLAQPTLSQWVKKLETELNCPLIERNHYQCVPTHQGQLFLPYAKSLLNVAIHLKDRISGKKIVIGAASNIGIYIMPDKIRQLTIANQQTLEIELVISTNPDIIQKLQNGEIDLAALEWWDDRPGFKACAWQRENLVIIVPPHHPWSNKKQVTLEQLVTQPILGGENGTGTGTRLTQILNGDADRLKVSQKLGSTEAVKRAVMAGMGISLVAQTSVNDEIASHKLYALKLKNTPLTKQLYLVHHANLPRQSPIMQIADQLLNV